MGARAQANALGNTRVLHLLSWVQKYKRIINIILIKLILFIYILFFSRGLHMVGLGQGAVGLWGLGDLAIGRGAWGVWSIRIFLENFWLIYFLFGLVG